MTRALLQYVTLCGVLAACSRPPTDAERAPSPPAEPIRSAGESNHVKQEKGGPPPVRAANEAPDLSQPPDLSGQCSVLSKTYEKRRTAAGHCAVPKNCTCYPDMYFDGLFRAADVAAARELSSLSDSFRRNQCPTIWADRAEEPECKATCRHGTCVVAEP